MSSPREWERARLGDVAEVRLGKMLDKSRTSGTPLPYLRNINVRWDSIDTTDLLMMPFKDDELERYAIWPGDLLVCEGGEPGRSAVWNSGETHLKYQKALHRVRLSPGIASRWVMYALMRDAYAGRLSRHFTGSTIAHLPREKLVEYEVAVPPTREQERIIESLDSYFSRLDAVVSILDRRGGIREHLLRVGRLKQAILDWAFEGKLIDRDPTDEPAHLLLARTHSERTAASPTRSGKRGRTPKAAS